MWKMFVNAAPDRDETTSATHTTRGTGTARRAGRLVAAGAAGVLAAAGATSVAGAAQHPPAVVVQQEAGTDDQPGAPPIERGDRSELAAWWQDRLNTWLALSGSSTGPLVVDGWYGPNTEAATVEFQEAVGAVPVDGVVNPEDRVALREAIDALESDPGAPPIERGDRSELAAWWQDRLNTWLALSGSSTGPLVVDGWYGPNTEAATVEFQEAVGAVPVDGVVNPEDRVALREAIEALGSDRTEGTDGDDGTDEAQPVGEFSTDARTADASMTETAGLTDVTTSVNDGFVRIAFDVGDQSADGLGYDVSYVDEVPVATSGTAPELTGDAYLQITMRPVSRFDLGDPDAEQTYTGPDRLAVDAADVVNEVVLVDDFEGVTTWVVGLPREAPFAVGTTEDGSLAVDVQR